MVQVLSSLTAVNVPAGAFLESATILIRVLVVMIMLCPVTTFPVERVSGVVLLTAAKSNFRILPMYYANVSFADGRRKTCVSFVWRETFSRVSSMCVGFCNCTYAVLCKYFSYVIPFMITVT